MDEISQEWIRSKGKIRWVEITGTISAPAKRHTRPIITEEPIPGRVQAPVIDAEQDQRDQLTTRLSLRSEK